MHLPFAKSSESAAGYLTQILFAAHNVNPENEVAFTYWCTYVVIGQVQTDSSE